MDLIDMSASEMRVSATVGINPHGHNLNRICRACGAGLSAEFLNAPDRFHWRPEMYGLARCEDCGYVGLTALPPLEDLPFHYDEDYHQAIAAAGEGTGRWVHQRAVISSLKRGGALLDIGCSSGGFLTAMMGGAWTLFGIEIEPSTAEKARRRTGAQVFAGNFADAPFSPGTFDVITCLDVLEHIYDLEAFLRKAHAWLKPQGIFYTILPNIDSWEFRMFQSYWYGLELPRHVSHFSPKSLRRLMASFGFSEVFVKSQSTNYVERSVDYVRCALIEKLGVSPTPQARRSRSNLPLRALRKAFRLCLFNPFGYVASMVGQGASIEAAFKKQ